MLREIHSLGLEKGLTVPIWKKEDHKGSNSYRYIKLPSIPGKVVTHLYSVQSRCDLLKLQRREQSEFNPEKAKKLPYSCTTFTGGTSK